MIMENHFDRIVGEKLGRIKVEYDPESWSLLEQRLDTEMAGTPEVNEQDMDEGVFDKLHNLQRPYNPSHWKQMAARLEQEFSFNRQVIRYKLVELGLVALLLLTIIQYLPLQYAHLHHNDHPLQTPSPLQLEEFPEVIPQDEKGMPDRPVAANEVPSSSAEQESALAEVERETIISERILSEQSSDSPTAFINSNRNTLKLDALAKVPSLTNIIESDQDLKGNYSLRPPAGKPLPKNTFEQPEPYGITAALNSPPLGALSYASLLNDPLMDLQPQKPKTFFRVGMFGGPEYNRVITPADEELGLEALSRYSLGYGGGLTFGIEFNRFEVESGLVYSAKQYKARPVLFFQGSFRNGYFGEGIKDIELNIINLPLNFRFNFMRNAKWRMYALAGASLQVAVQGNYYTADQDGFRSSSFAPAPAPSSGGLGNQGSFKTLAQDLPGGWFEGGSFEENGYLTGNVGLGLERYVSDGNWSIFVQPTYHHSINYFLRGLGPNKEEINTFSLYTGIRLRLRNK